MDTLPKSLLTIPLEEKKWFQSGMLLIVFVVILLSRADNLAAYGTADEPNYLKYSASFYYLLHEGRFGETDLIVHPGVTTLWAGALGFWAYFPDYVEDERTANPMPDLIFSRVLRDAELKKEGMLAIGRRFSVAFQSVLLLAAFYFGWQAFGFYPAFLGILLVSFDPFYFANSRILQPDGMLAACMLLGLTAFLAYLRTHSRWALLVSAVGTGLAILSKVPGVFLLPMCGLLLAVDWWWGSAEGRRTWNGVTRRIGVFVVWMAVVLLTIFAVWPVMWVKPVQALNDLLQFTLDASTGVDSSMYFNGQVIPEGEIGSAFAYYYPLSFVWRTTPVVLVGFVCGLSALWLNRKDAFSFQRFAGLAYLVAAILIVGLFTVSFKKFDRYILPAVLYLDMVSAFGFVGLVSAVVRKWTRAVWVMPAAAVLLIGWQAALVYQTSPYYHTYYNPWLGGLEKAQQVMMVGWGEGLDEAANYINQKYARKPLEIYSYYSATFDLYYLERSHDMPFAVSIPDDNFQQVMDGDYVIVYISQRQRHSAERVLDFLADKTPEYVVQIRGVEYVWVYNIAEIFGREPGQ